MSYQITKYTELDDFLRNKNTLIENHYRFFFKGKNNKLIEVVFYKNNGGFWTFSIKGINSKYFLKRKKETIEKLKEEMKKNGFKDKNKDNIKDNKLNLELDLKEENFKLTPELKRNIYTFIQDKSIIAIQTEKGVEEDIEKYILHLKYIKRYNSSAYILTILDKNKKILRQYFGKNLSYLSLLSNSSNIIFFEDIWKNNSPEKKELLNFLKKETKGITQKGKIEKEIFGKKIILKYDFSRFEILKYKLVIAEEGDNKEILYNEEALKLGPTKKYKILRIYDGINKNNIINYFKMNEKEAIPVLKIY